jgi:hypothetical protein
VAAIGPNSKRLLIPSALSSLNQVPLARLQSGRMLTVPSTFSRIVKRDGSSGRKEVSFMYWISNTRHYVQRPGDEKQ